MSNKREIVTFPDDALLTADELASYLRIDVREVYAMLKANEVPHVTFGRQYRIPYWGLKKTLADCAGIPYTPTIGTRLTH